MSHTMWRMALGTVLGVAMTTGATQAGDLLLHYSFESPDVHTDGQATDNSGNGLHGSITTNGSGSYSYVADSPTPNGTQSLDLVENGSDNARLGRVINTGTLDLNAQDWTWSGWFKRRDTQSRDMILHIGNGDGFGQDNELYVFAEANQTNLQLEHHAGSNKDVAVGTSSIGTGQWHHAAVVREGARLRFYVNGQQIGSDSDFTFNMRQDIPVYFGGQAYSGSDRQLDGQIDDHAIWTAPLSSFAIENLHNGNLTPETAPTQRSPELFLYYSYESPDATDDNEATDNSGNGRNGSFASAGTGSFSYGSDTASNVFGTQSLRLDENGSGNAAMLSRSIETSELNFSGQSWSFATWFKATPDPGNANNYLFHIGHGDGYGGENELYLNAINGNLSLTHHLTTTEEGNHADVNITASNVAADNWHHAVVLYDHDGGELKLYVNGELAGIDADFLLDMAQSGSARFTIGGFAGGPDHNVSDRFFDGLLDDTAVWTRLLSEKEIAGLYSGEMLTFSSVIPEPHTTLLAGLAATSLLAGRSRRRS